MQNNIMQMIALLSQSSNPMSLLQQMNANNPNLQKVLSIANGKTPEQLKEYVMNICATQGIDLQSLAKQYNLPL
jgi:hypothetical protein